METNAIQKQAIREYLLGGLSPDQQAQFEERLLLDDEVYEELVIGEDELVDEYLGDELSLADRQRFESYFVAAPERREKLNFGRAFRKYATNQQLQKHEAFVGRTSKASGDATTIETTTTDSRPGKRWFSLFPKLNPIVSYAIAAALLLGIAGIGGVVWKRVSAPRDPGQVLSVTLTPGLSRGDNGASNRIVIPAGTNTLRLRLVLPENRYSSFQATLLDIDGRELKTPGNVTAEVSNGQRAAVFDVSAEILPAGDYRIKLDGVDDQHNRLPVGTYSFSVQTQ